VSKRRFPRRSERQKVPASGNSGRKKYRLRVAILTKIFVWRIVRAVAIALICFAVFLFFFQQRMIYIPRPYAANWRSELPAGIVPLEFTTPQGAQTSFYQQPAAPCRTLWIVCGGNSFNALEWPDYLAGLPDPATGFLLVEYPGYGACAGRPSRESILENCQAALDAWRRHVGAEAANIRLNILGHSLGAAVALNFVQTIDADRLLLISPFTSMRDLARRQVGWPWHWLLRQNYDNRARLAELSARLRCPAITIVHGNNDQVIPVEMGRELAKLFPEIRYAELAGEDHNGILERLVEILQISEAQRADIW
jgi:pimeloyl-ACP methyl ester carboxylesterase